MLPRKRTFHIRKTSSEQGSIVLEAALVFPLFIFFILFLIYMVQMTLISTALQSTVSDTVKMVSTHMYPVALAITPNATEDVEGGSKLTGNWIIPKLSVTDWASEYSKSLPAPLSDWMMAAAATGDEPLQNLKNSMAEAVLDPIVKPLLKPFMQSQMLSYDRIHVSNIHVPDMKTRNNPYFGIELSYELPMRVPFINKKIVLQARSEERLWIGDTSESTSDGSHEGSDEDSQSIQLIDKPNPAVVGKKTKVRVKVAPNSTAHLSVFYKTGESTAKYLGWSTADADGYIEWEWSVGPNTTPGTWSFIVKTEDGQSIEVTFTVVGRD
ncbi:pilus assembly protein [Paenibacillus sp. DS2015]|uniref:pilus assembly protein n=1 Tax=Paenibacillus sp. DS2015 TaxID=3373917 RepID=UPI003D218FD3